MMISLIDWKTLLVMWSWMIRKPGFEEASRMFPGWSPSIMKRMLETPEKWDDRDIANIKEYMKNL